MKKIIGIFCLFSCLLVGGFTFAIPSNSVAYAAGNSSSDSSSGSIKDAVKTQTADSVATQVSTSGDSAIKLIRQVSITVVVIMLGWIGFTKFFSGNSQALADMKLRLGVLVIALIFAFKTEMVTGALLKIFGVDISSL
ncbi:MAG: hypothetical protein Q8934_18525 [Bacillota bacterium]|nr:hypothetical protein [Bacillota bacterium]